MASNTSTAENDFISKIHDLSDIELAILLCLISRENGILSTPSPALDDLIDELRLVATKTFGLTCSVIDCTPGTTLDDFAAGLFVPDPQNQHQSRTSQSSSNQHRPSDSYFVQTPRESRSSVSPFTTVPGSTSVRIANCVLAKNLDLAPLSVQIQALELLRTRRIFTHTSVQAVPKQFIFVPVLVAETPGTARVTAHLNDFFQLAHWHDPEDGFVNMEEAEELAETASTGSVVRRNLGPLSTSAVFSEDDINELAQRSQLVQVDIDVIRYQMNIISFLRMHRAVQDGISPAATKHFDKLMRCLAPLHGIDYVTPALVSIAAKKVYLHRIRITKPEDERSMQWGSKLEAVASILEDMGPEEVVTDVLEMVTAPI